jgi:hypothetical protein
MRQAPLTGHPSGIDPIQTKQVKHERPFRVWYTILYGANDLEYVRRQGNRFSISLAHLRTRLHLSSAEIRRDIQALERLGAIYNVVFQIGGRVSMVRFAMVLPGYLTIADGDPGSQTVSKMTGGPRWQYPEI